MFNVSPAVSAAVVARPFGRITTDALAACTALPAVPSATETLLLNVSVPDCPPGAVDRLVVSATAPTSVYALLPTVTVSGAPDDTGTCTPYTNTVLNPRMSSTATVAPLLVSVVRMRVLPPKYGANSALRASSSRDLAACSPLAAAFCRNCPAIPTRDVTMFRSLVAA